MHVPDEITLVPAPLLCDRETWRWYAEGGETCVVLSESGRLLEPLPTFGPACYVLIATNVQRHEADEHAVAHDFLTFGLTLVRS
jgi:hypothetical protein